MLQYYEGGHILTFKIVTHNALRTYLLCLVLVAPLFAEVVETKVEEAAKKVAEAKFANAPALLYGDGTIYTYDGKLLQESHAPNLYQFLMQKSQLFVRQFSDSRLSQSVLASGSSLFGGFMQMRVELDGKPLYGDDAQALFLSRIVLAQLQKVELFVNSESVLHSDGNTALLIKLTSKKEGAFLSAYGGTLGARGAELLLTHHDETLTLLAAAKDEQLAQLRLDSTGHPANQLMKSGFVKMDYALFKRLHIRLDANSYRYNQELLEPLSKGEYDNKPRQNDANKSVQNGDGSAVIGAVDFEFYSHSHLLFSFGKREKKLLQERSERFYDYRSMKAAYYLKDKVFHVEVGATYDESKQRISSDTLEKAEQSLYIYDKMQELGKVLTLGYKYAQIDYRNNQSEQTNRYTAHAAQLALTTLISDTSSSYINYTLGFYAPELGRFNQYNPQTQSSVFNGFSAPTSSQSISAGYTMKSTGNMTDLSVHTTWIDNERFDAGVYDDLLLSSTWHYGTSLFEQFYLSPSWYLLFSYQYEKAEVRKAIDLPQSEGKEIPGVPNHYAKAAMGIKLFNIDTVIGAYYHTDYYARDDRLNLQPKVGDFQSMFLNLDYSYKKLALFLHIDNLFNDKSGLFLSQDAIIPTQVKRTVRFGGALRF